MHAGHCAPTRGRAWLRCTRVRGPCAGSGCVGEGCSFVGMVSTARAAARGGGHRLNRRRSRGRPRFSRVVVPHRRHGRVSLASAAQTDQHIGGMDGVGGHGWRWRAWVAMAASVWNRRHRHRRHRWHRWLWHRRHRWQWHLGGIGGIGGIYRYAETCTAWAASVA